MKVGVTTKHLACSCVIAFLPLEQLLVAASASLSKSPADKDAEDQPERIPRTCQQLECVCYGLGPFASCVSARYQLAMLLLLLEAGQVRGGFIIS